MLGELTVLELKRELVKRGLESKGTKPELVLTLEKYIRENSKGDPLEYVFSAKEIAPTSKNQSSRAESPKQIDDEKTTRQIGDVLGEILERLKRVEAVGNSGNMQSAIDELLTRVNRLEQSRDQTMGNPTDTTGVSGRGNPAEQIEGMSRDFQTTHTTVQTGKTIINKIDDRRVYPTVSNDGNSNLQSRPCVMCGAIPTVTTTITNVQSKISGFTNNLSQPGNHTSMDRHWEPPKSLSPDFPDMVTNSDNVPHDKSLGITQHTTQRESQKQTNISFKTETRENPRSQHMGNTHNVLNNTLQYDNFVKDWPENSNLIPRENLQAAKDSLPEFAGKKEEDPVRFLSTTADVLIEAKIPQKRWVKVVAPQLKGEAGTWWGRIRVIDPTWDEFKKEFVIKFNGPQVRAKLYTELMGWRQLPDQTTGDFVLQKIQLFRRLDTGLDEENAVATIIELMREEHQGLVRVQKPKTFMELTEAAYVVETPKKRKETTKVKFNPGAPEEKSPTNARKQYKCWKCGGPHSVWKCTTEIPTKSGNGKPAGGNGKNPPVRR